MTFVTLLLMLYGEIQLENGPKLYYEKEGAGPPIVLIAGLASYLESWKDVRAKLTDRFTVISFDNRGVGRSGDLEGVYSTVVMADDTAGLMAELGYDSYHVAGISLGSFAAQQLALKYPERVKKLVLIASSLGGAAHVWPEQEVLTFFQTMGAMPREERVEKGLTLALNQDFAKQHPDQFAALKAFSMTHVVPDNVVQRQGFAGMGFDTSATAAKIDRPTLVIHGANDRVVVPENGKKVAAAIPNSRLVMLPDSGHACILDKPAIVAAVMADFLAEP